MNTSELSLRDLEYIVTVSETKHFGQAASLLHVSQPTLSAQIKKLEILLNTVIFERTNRSFKVTIQGEKIILASKSILDEAKKLIQIIKTKELPLEGAFHLGAIATIAPYYLPYIIAPLKKSYPKLELIIHEGMTDDLLLQLNEGKLSAIIASRTFDENNYRVYSLYHEPFWLAAPSSMSIPLREGKASIKNISKEKLLLLSEGNCLKDEVLNFCKMSKKENNFHLQSSSLETLRHLVAAGNGYTFFPELAINDDKRLKNLISYYPFMEKTAGREIVLVTRSTYPKPHEIRLLSQKLKEHLPLFK